MKTYIISIVLAAISALAISANAADKDIEHENKLNAIASLLTRSTISKQVLHSNNEAAIQYYKFAKSLYDDAVEAYSQGDINKSNSLIKKSRYALIDAVEFANLQGARKKRSKNDYESLRKSANALMDALERISAEKGRQDKFSALSSDISEKLSNTDKLYFQGQYKLAITNLGKILQTIKVGIAEIRSGDTLTKTLSFASAKEEYIYEIDRNDTHFLLLDMFLSEQNDGTKSHAIMNDTIQAAKNHRNEAEILASNFRHKEAIKMLEKSTMKIITVIRNTGVFIPN
ncbi:MAG: hypothetical protein OEY89_06320 [Gammaproteobacteria bacterium]|nr:hypothetical protein [Gammaproteobacteria bacterium]